jgi:shikimate kinase
MHLSLIGMSGSGKSTWSKKLSGLGFRHFCCDDLITKKLAPELTRPDGTIMELGEWMGFPYESQYKERESKYLAYEIQVLTEILGHVENSENLAEENIVVDTTGSVIYSGKEILSRLRRCTMVVHLSTPREVQELMLKAYLANKRPVLWRDFFRKEPNEANEAALARCYPRLLSSRERLYKQNADVTIDYYTLNQNSFGVDNLLNIVSVSKAGNKESRC